MSRFPGGAGMAVLRQPPALQQPVLGAPTPVQSPALQQPVLGAPTPAMGFPPSAAAGGTSFTAAGFPAPNPYNLPSDMVGGQPQQQQFAGLLGQFEQARQAATQAQEQRYASILGGGMQPGGVYGGPGYLDIARQSQAGLGRVEAGYGALAGDYAQRTQNIMGQMQSLGGVQRQDLKSKFQQEEARLKQDLINRGLYTTTLYDSMRRALQNQQQRQESQLEDVLTRQQVEYQKSLTGEELAARAAPIEAAERGVTTSAAMFGQPLGVMERRTDVGPSYEQVAGVAGAVGAGQAGVPPYLSALGTQPRTVAGIRPPAEVGGERTQPSVGAYQPSAQQGGFGGGGGGLPYLQVGSPPGGTTVASVRRGGPVAGALPLGAAPYFGPGGGGGAVAPTLGGVLGRAGGGGGIGGGGGGVGGGGAGIGGLTGPGAIQQFGGGGGGGGGQPVINPYAQPPQPGGGEDAGAEPQPAHWGNPEWVAWARKTKSYLTPFTGTGGGGSVGAPGMARPMPAMQ